MIHSIESATTCNLFFLQQYGRQIITNIVETDQLNDFCRKLYDSSIAFRETVFAVFIDKKNNVVGVIKAGEGDAHSCIYDKMLIIRTAILLNSYDIILCHNHPGGDVRPSQTDIKSTRSLNRKFKPLNIKIIGDIILSGLNADYKYIEY